MIHVTPHKCLVFIVTAAAAALAGLSAQAEEAAKPMVVAIHADWCGTCTRLEPTIDAVRSEVGSDARVVVLDVTDRSAVERSRAKAEELGITAFFDEYKSRTGAVGVLDATGKPVQVLEGETDPQKYLAALKEA
ncbi:MAG: thioredoxin family protein [Myxococcota bacterium]|nr:thioredoxin family protein [Myxococcota bacterium]